MFFTPPRPRLSLQTPAPDRVKDPKRSLLRDSKMSRLFGVLEIVPFWTQCQCCCNQTVYWGWYQLNMFRSLQYVFVRPLREIQRLGYGVTRAQLRRLVRHLRQKVHVKGTLTPPYKLTKTMKISSEKVEKAAACCWCGIDYRLYHCSSAHSLTR